jgi:hypothetical protein
VQTFEFELLRTHSSSRYCAHISVRDILVHTFELLFVVGLLNLASSNGRRPPPLQRVYGQQVDVSAYMTFHFWELVYYAEGDGFPSGSGEKLGRWIGPADDVGDFLTYKILTVNTFERVVRLARWLGLVAWCCLGY